MRKRILLSLLTLTLALLPMVALAQALGPTGDVVVRYDGPLRIGPGETVPNAWVIYQDATIDGTVQDTLWVIGGNATISGRVNGSITVIDGRLDLRQGAQVQDVNLENSTLNHAPDAIVSGVIQNWTGVLTAVEVIFDIIAGLIFAAVGGRQLTGAGRLMVERPGRTIISALIVSIGLLFLALFVYVLAFVTGFSVVYALLFFLGLFVALWYLGFVVSGALLGAVLVSRVRPRTEPVNRYLAVVVGILLLEIIGQIPFVGLWIVALAMFLGAGALALLAWRAWRQPGAPREELAPPSPRRPAAPA